MVQDRFRELASAFNGMSVRRQRWLVVVAFLLLQAVIWLLLELLYYHGRPITDTSVYYHYAGRIMNGYFPYRDFSAEYPPVAMLIFLLPRIASGAAYDTFVYWFELEMLIFSFANVVLLSAIAWERWRDIGRLAAALALYSLFIAMIGFIVAARFDIAAAFLILACVAAFMRGHRATAWLLLGAGVMTKVIPVLIAPLFLLIHLRRREKGWLYTGPILMITTAAAIATPFLIASSDGLARTFLYHAERPLQIESTWATPILLLSYVGYGVRMFSSYGSHNLFTPASNFLAALSGPVTVLFLIVGYRFFWKRISSGKAREDETCLNDQLLRFTIAIVVIFIAGGKVLSPQFLIWLIPLMPLVAGADRSFILSLFGLVLLLTQLEFPFFYGDLLGLNPLLVVQVAVRNALLVWLAVILIREPVPRTGKFGLYKVEPRGSSTG